MDWELNEAGQPENADRWIGNNAAAGQSKRSRCSANVSSQP